MCWFRKSKKARKPSKQPNPDHTGTRVHTSFDAELDLGIDLEGASNRREVQPPTPDGKAWDQRLCPSKTAAPTHWHEDSFTRPERGRDVPSNGQNEQVEEATPTLYSTEGELEAQIRGEHGERRKIAQQPPWFIPEPRFDGGRGGADTFQDVMQEDQKLPGTLCIAMSDAECRNDPTVPFSLAENTDGPEGGGIEPEEELKEGAYSGTFFDAAKEAAERFGPLRAILRVISANYADDEGSIDTENKIGRLLPRIVELEGRFNFPPCDAAEQRRQDELILEFGRVEGQLGSFAEGPGRCAEEVSVLLEGLRGAIFDYQVALQKEIHDKRQEDMNSVEATVLDNFRSAKGAEYRHGNRNGCLNGTRVAVLDGIELWARDLNESPVYWLNGLAGTGKTTIAQTVAERLFANGQLGASFFCSRDFQDRSDLKLIFPTLATQLAREYAEFRSIFVQLVQRDPEIAQDSLYNQMNKLIVRPLQESGISTVIVIDALDECRDKETASAILSVLGRLVSKIPQVKFFLTGRPEPRIQTGFHLPLLAKVTDVFILHNVEPSLVNNDIQLFLRQSFLEISRRWGGLDGWPTREDIDNLCERSAGLFVYAVATIRFIEYKAYDPKRQLELLLRRQDSTAREGKTKFNSKTTLDILYTSILREAFGDDDLENDRRFRSILGAVVLAANPLSPSAITTLLGFDTTDVSLRLSSAHSLLVLEVGTDRPVRAFHRSFPDFITNPARCTNPRFHICPPDQHTELLVRCVELMDRRLEKNMFRLPDGVTNSEVDDLGERIEQHVDKGLEYACRSWHKHLVCTIPAHVAPVLHGFLEKKFLFWLEVLSVLGAAREAVDALEAVEKCELPDASPTLKLVRDYVRFVITFFEVINKSAPHIYHSALLLSPRTSITHEIYKNHASPLARVVQGIPDSWERAVATADFDRALHDAVWSPCSRFIAVAKDESVEVLDAVTLSRLSFFEGFSCPTLHAQQLSFSPDGRCLTVHTGERLISWDFQTGGPLGTIPSGLKDQYIRPFSFKHSEDGNVVVVAYKSRYFGDGDDKRGTFIYTYDLLSERRAGPRHVPEGQIIHPIWTHDEYFRFATIDPKSIRIWQSPFTLEHPPVVVASFPVPDGITDANRFLFLPARSRLSFELKNTVQVWDVKTPPKLLLESELATFSHKAVSDPTWGSFSPDGRFFAYVNNEGEVHVWEEHPAGYVLHQRLPFFFPPDLLGLRLSPNGESIFLPLVFTIHRWHTRDQVLSLPSASTENSGLGDLILGFSPNEHLAAFARQGGNTVTIIDLQSGEPKWKTDTGVEICCLKMAGDTVIVVGLDSIVTWNLPSGDRTFHASVNDIVRTTILDPSSLSHNLSVPRYMSIGPDLSYIVVTRNSGMDEAYACRLEVYDVFTGLCLARIGTDSCLKPQFIQGGREVWAGGGVYFKNEEQCEIIEDSKFGAIVLKLQSAQRLSWEFWESSRGYSVTDGWWVLSPSKKRLLWLPHRWRSSGWDRTWGEQFLGLPVQRHGKILEVVILELLE